MGTSRAWDFSNVYAKDICGRAGTRSLAALSVMIPALMALMALMVLAGAPMGVARAAIDLDAKVDVELLARTGNARDFVVRDGGVLRTGDGLQLRLASNIEAYVYIIAYGSSHTAVLLHPFSARPADALIRPGQREVIPEPGVFLPLDGREGLETLFTIGSDAPVTDIADLLARIEKHGGDLAAISAMLNERFPLARRLSFKHIGASPLVGVTGAAPRATASRVTPDEGASQQDPGASSGFSAGPSLLPPATGGWAVSSTKSFATSATPPSDSPAPAAQAAGRAEETTAAAPAVLASVAGNEPASTAASENDARSVSSARQKARQAAGIDEQRFRGILATLPDGGVAEAPQAMGESFREQGVLSAQGSRIRALERAQLESGPGLPGGNDGNRKEFQN